MKKLSMLLFISLNAFAGNGVERSDLPPHVMAEVKSMLSTRCNGNDLTTVNIESVSSKVIGGDQYDFDTEYLITLTVQADRDIDSSHRTLVNLKAMDYSHSDLSRYGVVVSTIGDDLDCSNQ